MPSTRVIGVTCLCLAIASLALAQRGGGFGGRFRSRQRILPNAPYDGRFTFVRVNYETAPGGYWYGGLPAWAHGYPVAEDNLMRIMNEVSYLGAHDDGVQRRSRSTIRSSASIRWRTSSRPAGGR